MSSISRSSAAPPSGSTDVFTKFVNITTPSYYDSIIDNFVPIPFSYYKGVLDINIQDNVETDLINGAYEPLAYSSRLVSKLGGTGIVQSLGPNLVTYLKNFLAYSSLPITVSNDIQNLTVVGQSIVTKIQQPAKTPIPADNYPIDLSGQFSQFETFFLSDQAPTSDSYLSSGSDADNFGTSWVFQTPLTVGYTHDGIQGYVTFTTTFTKNFPFFIQCFLGGSLVDLVDGTRCAIENVCVGDKVLGAFGEVNSVLGLHKPLLGENELCRINNEHSCVAYHPHVSFDGKFYSLEPSVLAEVYGKAYDVENANATEKQLLHGLNSARVSKLTTGVLLKTVDGSREVETVEQYSLSPDTQLYNLVLDGSHTYHVDGYAVTGWPREDDFDYDTWKPKV